jgi:hypothetical protein
MRTGLVVAVLFTSISFLYILSQGILNDKKVVGAYGMGARGYPNSIFKEASLAISSQSRSSSATVLSIQRPIMAESPTESQSSSSAPLSAVELSIKQKEYAERRFASINERLAKEPGSNVTDVMEALFNEEPVDNTWASENEEKIYNFFRDAEVFRNFSPELVTCKSSSCKVTIASPDNEVSEQIRFAISRQIAQTASDIPPTYTSVIDPEKATLTIYFQKGPM